MPCRVCEETLCCAQLQASDGKLRRQDSVQQQAVQSGEDDATPNSTVEVPGVLPRDVPRRKPASFLTGWRREGAPTERWGSVSCSGTETWHKGVPAHFHRYLLGTDRNRPQRPLEPQNLTRRMLAGVTLTSECIQVKSGPSVESRRSHLKLTLGSRTFCFNFGPDF